MFLQEEKNNKHESFISFEKNQSCKIDFLNRYLPAEKCDVRDDLSALALIRYKWLRGQYKAAGKSICIHLTLLSAVESANYFSAELKALCLRWVAKGAQLGQQSTPAE